MSGLKTLMIWSILALSWAIYVSLTFLTWGMGAPATGVFIQFAAAAIILGVFFGGAASRTADDLVGSWQAGNKRDTALAVAASLSLALSFLLMVIKRYGFAPAGSDIVFLLATSPVFIILISLIIRAERVTLGMTAGSAAAVLGAMAVVGNWERPSSFSPFSRFPLEEGLLLLSALALALFVVLLWRLSARQRASGVATLAVWAALPALLLIARVTDGWAGFTVFDVEGYVVLAAAGAIGLALPLMLLSALTRSTGAVKASTAVFLSPVVITLLTGVEQSFGTGVMPTPFLWAPVLTGAVVILLGVTAAWLD